MRRKLVVGNWKMNGLAADLAEIDALAAAHPAPGCEVVICPPATLIAGMKARAGVGLAIGGQDCHAEAAGAHTGDISAAMLVDAGASHVILGHSERRADHGESNETVRAKVAAALSAGLAAIVCVGETEAERDAGAALDVVARQLAGSVTEADDLAALILAYEPVWAIGTGRTPGLDQIAEMHGHLRAQLTARFGAHGAARVRLLYGGSVKPDNAAAIFGVADVDGALVGGASLKAAEFSDIIAALEGAGS
jgi:triosephosphate isomerase